MNHASLAIVAVIWGWVLFAVPAAAQPSIGEIIRNSRDYEESIWECPNEPLCYDPDRVMMVCCPAGGAGETWLSVTLTTGTLTTVTDAAILATSSVECGCRRQKVGYTCNAMAATMAEVPNGPITVSAGSATVPHTYAVGDEVLPCVVR